MEMINKNLCTDFISGLMLIDDEMIDLTITSPPYDDIRTYNNKVKTNKGDEFSFDFDGIVKELFRVTKDGGIVVWVVGDQVKNGGETGKDRKSVV
jgi:site-specific DNA-methyltransferase (adenine-specific)